MKDKEYVGPTTWAKAVFWIIITTSIIVILFNMRCNIASIFKDLSVGALTSGIFYFILVYIPEKSKVQKIKRNMDQAVSYMLEAFSGNPFHWSKHIRHSQPIENHERKFHEMHRDVKEKKLNVLQRKVIVESAHEVAKTYEQLIPVAFQLSSEHASLWLSLTNSIKQVASLYPIPKDNMTEEGFGLFELNLTDFIEYGIEWYNLKV